MESQLLSVPEFHRFGANALADWAKWPSPPVGNYDKTLPRTLP